MAPASVLARNDAFRATDASSFPDAQLARHAVAALCEEAQLTPKPALVDRRGSGAHRDLDLGIMLRSAHSLEPTFAALARAARRRAEPSALLRTELAQIGRAGEQDMLRATGGSNAHRGAIWIIGLLTASAAMPDAGIQNAVALRSDASSQNAALIRNAFSQDGLLPGASLPRDSPPLAQAQQALSRARRICKRAAHIASFEDRFAAPVTNSNGERVRTRYQVGGARSEAQNGFPHVIDTGLPALLAARALGIDENAARIDALLAIMATLDDTCLLHRAGMPGLQAGQHGARRVLDAGGSSTSAGRAALDELERGLMALNASPGGAADLLAATLFLDTLAPGDASRNYPASHRQPPFGMQRHSASASELHTPANARTRVDRSPTSWKI